MKIKISLLFTLLISCSIFIQSQIPAFPGAEGGGMYTTGGRGGKVLYVTSLEDNDEPGTLRWAINQKGARTVLFNVSGEIRLNSPLSIINGDLTIAGQSAPGDGICISDYETKVNANNVVIRFLRFRLGDRSKQAVDALSGVRSKNVIIDHCSISWSVDEVSSFYDNEDFTMQWCFIAEGLRYSVHPKGRHGFGGIWGGSNATFHHNLLINNDSRNPRFCGSRYNNRPDLEKVDFRNNVIYNWGGNNIYAAEGGRYNIVNNYFKSGPATSKNAGKRILNPDADNGENRQPEGVYGEFYVNGNYLDGNPEVTKDNTLGIELGTSFSKHAPKVKLKDLISKKEYIFTPVVTDAADVAYDKVLKYGGCSTIRDIHDNRYVDNVRNSSYSFEGSSGSINGLIDSQEDVGGWPVYLTYHQIKDSNHDGIPDEWLDNNYPGKTALDLNHDGYTLLEVYLNSLVSHLMINSKTKDNTLTIKGVGDKPIKRFVVDKSGKGDFRTIQSAIDAVRSFDPDWSTVIFVEEGRYHEKIIIPDFITDLKIIGKSRDNTIITNNDHANINNMGTFKTYTLQIRGSNIVLENITIENNAPQMGQAVALHTEGDGLIFINCSFLGNQDTVYTGRKNGRHYFQDCYIEGTTDFIFGSASAWFEECEIHCKKNSYITAASTPEDVKFGYIFNNCDVTVGDNVTSMYLGRPWREYGMTLFMNCKLPKEIKAEGWHNWGKVKNERTARYYEYNNSGEGSNTDLRVSWSKVLTIDEAKIFTLRDMMKDLMGDF